MSRCISKYQMLTYFSNSVQNEELIDALHRLIFLNFDYYGLQLMKTANLSYKMKI